jgi:S-DNA-T family DNA segregation ATPase FtsK/SpoIIIE
MKKSKVSRLTKKETPAKTTRTKRSSSHEDFNISTDIKKQLLGFLILLFGVLIGLALISYSDKDQATLEKLSLLDVFRREAYSAVNVTFNWLGIAGAYVSNFFINSFFGYFSIFVAVVLVLFGSTLLRKKPLGKTIQFSIYSLLLMLCLASTFGLLRIFTGRDAVSAKLSGTSGDFFASVFYQTLGSAGASIFFGLFLILFSLLLIDGNIIKTFARIKLLSEKILESFHQEKTELTSSKEKVTKNLSAGGNKDMSNSNIDELEEALKKERERILKSKYSKQNAEELSEFDRIKETEINRPKQDEPAKIIIQEKKIKESKPELVSNTISRDEANEIEINPQNSNEVDKLASNREEDFVEEKLEKYIYPNADLLIEPTKEEFEAIPNEELTENGRLLQAKLLKFGIEVEKVFATPGPVVTSV